MRFAKTRIKTRRRSGLNIGFAATIDCATVVAAKELGLFDKHGLDVRLTREVGWATIREKLLHEELDAAAAHASMLFSIYCGIGVVRRSCLTGLLLSANGSAITLSNELWNLGVRDAVSLGRVVQEFKGKRVFTFGVVLELSSQNFNFRKWLAQGDLDPDRDVRIAVIPSELVFETFRAGHLDGYCVAEPWNSAAVLSRAGWIAATTAEIESQHPEKVLLVLQEFAEKREEEHLRMIAALIEAGRFCDVPENRPELARMLAQPCYFNTSQIYLMNALVGPLNRRHESGSAADFVIYDPDRAGAPTRDKGNWVIDLARSLSGPETRACLRREIVPRVFREDIFEKAGRLWASSGASPESLSDDSKSRRTAEPNLSSSIDRQRSLAIAKTFTQALNASLNPAPKTSSPGLCA